MPPFYTYISASGFSGLLDQYPGATAAYSLRKLNSGYTGNCIKVRRSSDNTELDIGFSNNELNTLALTSFVGASSGFITVWYDQSGSGNNMVSNTISQQPLIVSSGVVNLLNLKPAINATSGVLQRLFASNISYNECLIAVVFNRTGRVNTADSLYSFDTSPFNQLFSNSSNWTYFSGTSNATTIPLSAAQKLITQIDNGVQTLFYDNSVLNSTFNVSNNIVNQTLQLFAFQTAYGMQGNIQEFILYSADKTPDRTGIETNINNYYSIY